MSKLTMNDMNSLNAIARKLASIGDHMAADVLFGIQMRATEMILQEEANSVHIQEDYKCYNYKERPMSDTESGCS